MPETDLALIQQRIYTIRGVRVILDSDLAALYGVPTKRLNEQYRRNRKRFPEDFAFQLTAKEANSLRSQFATSSSHGGRRYRPYAFTEHGALMAANILNSARAVQMSIFVVRAFAKMREALRGTPELTRKLVALEKKLTSRLDVHEAAIVQVLQEIMQILNLPPPPLEPEPPRRRIGFHQP
jgi:phage regulator Rha-like protein